MGRATEFFDYINREPGDFPELYKQTRAYINIDDNLKRIRRQYRKQIKNEAKQLKLFTT